MGKRKSEFVTKTQFLSLNFKLLGGKIKTHINYFTFVREQCERKRLKHLYSIFKILNLLANEL